jgi:hypothetical protein
VIHIAATNMTSFDIGLQIGQQSKNLFNDIEHRYDSFLKDSFSQMGFDDMLRERLPDLKSTIDKTYQKELEGVASAWALNHENKLGDGFLSWDEFWVLNLLPDIGLPANGTGFGILNRLSEENGALVGRNLDLKSTPAIRSLQAITVYQYADYAVVNIGFAGIVSVITGFNESGLFVAHFNAAPDSSYQNPYRPKKYMKKGLNAQGFILRKALETLTTTPKAINFIAGKNYGISNNIMVADKKNIQVLEVSSGGKSTIRRWSSDTRPSKKWGRKSQIAVVDCHVLSNQPDNCIRAKDGYRWDRLRLLADFTNTKKAGVQDIARIMLDKKNKYYEIMSANTLQSMIYLPGSGHLYLYAAPANKASNKAGIPPFYQVYFEELIPAELRKQRNRIHYLWWISGLLMLLLFTLWITRRSINKADSKRLLD